MSDYSTRKSREAMDIMFAVFLSPNKNPGDALPAAVLLMVAFCFTFLSNQPLLKFFFFLNL